MPDLLLRRNVIVKSSPDDCRVILPMADGYELDVGGISRLTGAQQREFWQWSSPGHTGQAASRDAAMVAIRTSWSATADHLAGLRREQEWTANKYALWAAGYRDRLGKGPVQCRCGALFDPGYHDQTMAHIAHITGRSAGT